jgi:hypothetical protein
MQWKLFAVSAADTGVSSGTLGTVDDMADSRRFLPWMPRSSPPSWGLKRSGSSAISPV